jgi:hypothetical protein
MTSFAKKDSVMNKVKIRGWKKAILGARSGRGVRKTRWRPGLELLEVRQTPAVFTVNTILDTVAANLQTGKDAAGHVSLRSAIMAANAQPGADTINLPSGSYKLTLPGASEDGGASGDLDIKSDLTIKGSGSSVIDGNSLDRVFEVLSGNVRISGVTIRNGLATQGAGLLNLGGNVTLANDTIANNRAIGVAGSLGADGTVTHLAGGRGGDGGDAAGGGVDNEAGSLTITSTTIASNTAMGGRGGLGFGKTAAGPGGLDVGGQGGAGGDGGAARGGGVYTGSHNHWNRNVR